MTTTVNIYEAKTRLSSLVDRAAQGETVIIARNGRPVAKLAPLTEQQRPRKLGLRRGQVQMREEFDLATVLAPESKPEPA